MAERDTRDNQIDEAALLSNGELLQLYSTAKAEEFHFLTAHHSRVAFYAGLLSTLLAATIGGLASAKEPLHYGLLLIGPFISILVALTAFSGTLRPYRRFLEAVTMVAKLEERLGLAEKPQHPRGPKWYQTEALVPCRFTESRNQVKDSGEFVDSHRRKGYRRAVLWLLWVFILCNIVVAVLAVLLLAGVLL